MSPLVRKGNNKLDPVNGIENTQEAEKQQQSQMDFNNSSDKINVNVPDDEENPRNYPSLKSVRGSRHRESGNTAGPSNKDLNRSIKEDLYKTKELDVNDVNADDFEPSKGKKSENKDEADLARDAAIGKLD